MQRGAKPFIPARVFARFCVSVGLLALTLHSVAFAQGRENRIGLLAGVNFARLGGIDVVDAGTRTSLVAGLFSRNGFTEDFGLESQLLYSEQGAQGDVAPGVSGTVQLSYLKVPVLLTYAIPMQGAQNVRPRVFAGPAVAFKVGCKVRASAGPISASFDCEDAELDTKTTDFSLVFGAGVDVGALTFGVRYDHGLSSIDDSPVSLGIKNRLFALTVGYSIRVGN